MEHWVASYGGLALFTLLMFGIVGLPVPDETLLVFCGYLIYKGQINPIGTWLGAAGGSTCGITCSYLIGRTVGSGLIHSRLGRFVHITDDRVRLVHDWFNRIGHWALLVGYYVPGLRHFTAIVAGTSRLEYRSFAVFAYTGAVLWVSSFLMLGYFFGDNWERMFETVHHHLMTASIVAGVAIVAYVLVRWMMRRRESAATEKH